MYSIYDQINNRRVLVYPERTTVDAKTTDSVVLTNEQIASTYFPEDIDVKPEIYFDKVEIGEGNYIYNGDNIEVLRTLPDNSVDSVVTDPPYGLKFMGKQWDYDVPSVELWKECYRVLKPGGYLLSFGSSRTYHRMAVKVEDAGFEIRDQIMWVYGSGFPKSHNVGLSIDKLLGHPDRGHRIATASRTHPDGTFEPNGEKLLPYETKSEEAKAFEGFGTALKPAHEPIVLARKPFKGSVAKNVLKWSTGGININDCRIEFEETKNPATNPLYRQENDYKMPKKGEESNGVVSFTSSKNKISSLGRFPANIIFDEEAGILLDEQSGECGNGWKKNYGEKDYKGKQYNSSTNQCIHGGGYSGKNTYSDKGGASRFFYCPKPSKKERNEGMPIEIGEFSQRPRRENGTVIYKETHLEEWTQVMSKLKRKDKTSKAAAEEKLQENSNGLKNNHPTIKPIKLMQYLIRLVTPIGGITIDPYFGSGSSGKSTIRENNDYKFIGIEKEKEYFNIAVERCQFEHEQSLKVAA
jgi:site-specific DNA-methyltransferase (adenine-specific)